MIKKSKIDQQIKLAYLKLKEISPNLKEKYSNNIKIKGKRTKFDSVDIVTFFSFLESQLKASKIKCPQFLDKNFFFKFDEIKIKDLIILIYKKNA